MQAADPERVLVLAPTRADAILSRTILTGAGLLCKLCHGLHDLLREWTAGAGALLLTDEVLAGEDPEQFAAIFQDQPAWSDLPIVLLSAAGADSAIAVWAMERLGNVTVLERPVRVTTLVSALQTAIRARRRQYQLRDQVQAQALLASVVQSSDDAIVSKTLDGIITSWNAGAERLFGYSSEEAIGQSITLIIPPERLEEERMILERLREGERLQHMETVRVSKTGQRLDISVTISPIRDPAGRVIGASKVARDITARKQAADRVLHSEARFRFLAETIPSIVWTAAPDGKITYANQRWLEFCGIRDLQRATSLPELTVHPDDVERSTKAWRAAHRGARTRARRSNRELAATAVRTACTAGSGANSAVRVQTACGGPDSQPVRHLRPTTHGPHAAAATRNRLADTAQKDEFLATLAHELRNPLAPIRNGLQIMRLAGSDDARGRAGARHDGAPAAQMVRLIDDLLDVEPHHARQARAAQGARRAGGRAAATRWRPPAADRRRGARARGRRCRRAGVPGCRPDAAGAGILEPAEQRREVHGPRRPHLAHRARTTDSEVAVAVRDNGIGIPARGAARTSSRCSPRWIVRWSSRRAVSASA